MPIQTSTSSDVSRVSDVSDVSRQWVSVPGVSDVEVRIGTLCTVSLYKNEGVKYDLDPFVTPVLILHT